MQRNCITIFRLFTIFSDRFPAIKRISDVQVYTVEFIEELRNKMARAECLYCDKTFKNYKTLREHMRKKLHKKLNPSNTGQYLV